MNENGAATILLFVIVVRCKVITRFIAVPVISERRLILRQWVSVVLKCRISGLPPDSTWSP